MREGIFAHPERYPGLSENSSFVDFQEALSEMGVGNCPHPCACHTAQQDEECYGHVIWAMHEGIYAYPEWYPGLSVNSSFVDFQSELSNRNFGMCSKPCEDGPETELSPTAPAPATNSSECHTAHSTEWECYMQILWAMHQGIFAHPEWYPGLHVNSSFVDFQRALAAEHLGHCPMPCACHTAQEGEACYEHVMWAMHEGIHTHPEWYPRSLNVNSSLVDFQHELFDRNFGDCPEPCSGAAVPAMLGGTAAPP
jgi:hypothetical protein